MTFRITLCIAVFALGIGLRAQTANGVSAEEEARRITDRIRGLQAESDRLAGEARTLLTDLRKLEAERNVQVQRVRDAQTAIVEIQTAIEGTAQRLLALEAQRIAQLPAMETQLVDMYKRGRSGFARLVLSAGGIREFGRATRAAAAMLRVSEERIAQHRGTAQALGQERAKLEAELDARRAREAEARLAQAAADKAVAESAALLTRVDSQRDVNARLAGELQVEQARLTQQEAGRIAAADAPAVSNATATPARAPALTFGPTGPARGTLLWPVSGRVTGRFARRVAATEDPAAANGLEIASREGNLVRALHSGTVSFAGPLEGFGNLVIVDHGDNTLSVYGYMGSVSVNRDDMVISGGEIGRVGLAPSGTAALFLEIRIDGRSVDPVQWLRPL
jgi:septal ring factor EnvC (AmiA/AmiB activator)